ncbi:hypothetical protein ILYODFUR_005376 [Ilyodon furcidens]|uniref:40S ribosomal protein S6 n=1 Tax=Ilyodon furcidens TaxID=33524 RepID=A0ABV0TSM0_9TELE
MAVHLKFTCQPRRKLDGETTKKNIETLEELQRSAAHKRKSAGQKLVLYSTNLARMKEKQGEQYCRKKVIRYPVSLTCKNHACWKSNRCTSPEHTIPTMKQGGGSIMLWGLFSS